MAVSKAQVSAGAPAAGSCLTERGTVHGAAIIAFAVREMTSAATSKSLQQLCEVQQGCRCVHMVEVAVFLRHQRLKLVPSSRLLDALGDEGCTGSEGLVGGGARGRVTWGLGCVSGMLVKGEQWEWLRHSVPGNRTEEAYWGRAGLLCAADASGWYGRLQQCSGSILSQGWQGLALLVLQLGMQWHASLW